MKNLVIACMLLVGFTLTAQEHDKKKEDRKEIHKRAMDLTPQQMASLQTKKMALHLDLNETQQKEIEKLNLEIAIKRKAMASNRKDKKEISSNEKVAMREQILEDKIAAKKKLKSILTEAQYEKWEKENTMRKRGMAERKKNKKEKR